ncbi:hypothetical protein HYU14_02240 [Candidatus Woesearchaeota archaeon]|nr:hypothetical protein [Candidatus Woesearchaeota archaeon]
MKQRKTASQGISPFLFPFFFREIILSQHGTPIPVDISDVSTNTLYLEDKLGQGPKIIQGHEAIFQEGVSLLQLVQKEYEKIQVEPARYSNGIKASLADYVSRVMTQLLKVEEVDKEGNTFTNSFRINLKPRNREVFAYGLQIVDALIELSIQTGTIGRKDIPTWKTIRQKYEAFHPVESMGEQENALARDKILIDGYPGFVDVKTRFRQAYVEHKKNLAFQMGWTTETGSYKAIQPEK